MSNQKNKKEHKLLNLIGGDKLILLAAIVVVFALFTCLNRNFLTWQNLVNLLVAASLVGIVAVGHTYLIIAGQNDLSPGSLAAFSGTLAALLLLWDACRSFYCDYFTCRCCSRSFQCLDGK